jgi:hypothetical protein
MRVGLTVSIAGHAVILGLGLIALGTKPLQSEKIDALPVDLVSIDEETDLLKGDKTSKIVPEEKPQPTPTVEAEVPAPEPAEKPAEKVVEVPAPPPPPPLPPPPPPPEPVVAPEPETQVASIPEPAPELAPAPEVVPEPAPVPVNPNIPRPRPNPPKPIAQPKPEPAPQRAEPEAPKQQFNADDIAALLNKQEARGGAPAPAAEPQTLGSIEGHAEAAMTQSEIAALKARLYRCWNPPVAVREASNLVVTVHINLFVDGSLAGAPQIVGGGLDPLSQIAAESAVRAVVQCAPFGDILSPETYALWSEIEFVFDPREMLGG